MDRCRPSLPDTLPERSIGYRLWRLRHAWTRRVEAALAPTGLTHTQFFLLRAIEHVTGLGRVPSQTRLADFLHIDRMTVSKVVRTLEAKAAVTRGVHPEDTRANSVEMTPRGWELVAQATRLVLNEQDSFFGRLGPDARAAFEATVDQLLEHAGADPVGPEPEAEFP